MVGIINARRAFRGGAECRHEKRGGAYDVATTAQRIWRQRDHPPKRSEQSERYVGNPAREVVSDLACFEIGRRFFKTPDGKKPITIRTASQVYAHLSDMRDLPKEHLRGLYLDSHYELIHDEVISIGSLTSNIIHPREVFARRSMLRIGGHLGAQSSVRRGEAERTGHCDHGADRGSGKDSWHQCA